MCREREKFYPRLTSAARRTLDEKFSFQEKEMFQSAPHFSREANLSPGSSGVKDRVVSIRASLQQRGEPIQRALLARWELFQSAPHFSSEANLRILRRFYACKRVSIRASLQQRGELIYAVIHTQHMLFQSAPHFSSGANPLVANAPAADNVFQSAPHFSSEANACYSVIAVRRRSVSIRASLQQRGEQFNS